MARQAQIPGDGFLNETHTAQFQLPGAGCINEAAITPVAYYPDTTAVVGNWTTSTGSGSLYEMIDEAGTPALTDYIQSPANSTNEACTIEFTSLLTPGSTSPSDYHIKYVAWGDSDTNLKVELIGGDGTTVIATWNHTPLPTDNAAALFTQTLTQTEVNNWVTAGFANSRLRFTAGPT